MIPPSVHASAWTEKVLYRFENGAHGYVPTSNLTMDASGHLYGTTYWGSTDNKGTVFMLTPPAAGTANWSETVLHTFKGDADGARPLNGLVPGPNGSFYGTTSDYPDSTNYFGTIFKLTPPHDANATWTETVLYNFKGGTRGAGPSGVLLPASDGAIYGSTDADSYTGPYGDLLGPGTVFKLVP